MTTRQRKRTQGKSANPKRRVSDVGMVGALKSFVGHLEGTGKAAHTISSYRFDLLSFEEFLRSQKNEKGLASVRTLSRKDLERYHDWLKLHGQKTNTRRRKLMTVRKLMQYLAGRKKLDLDIARKLPAPEKIERVPRWLDAAALRRKIAAMPTGTHLGTRNAALVSFLLETGASVSEATALRWTMLDLDRGVVRFTGKSEREIELPKELVDRLRALKAYASDASDLCFVGFNRHGPLRLGKRSLAITSRGVEMLVKAACGEMGFEGATPRTLRHTAVVDWYRGGTDQASIQKRLGLRTAYSFRIYGPIFASIRSSSTATSTS
jgi:site-specific recombinase XerD